MIKIPKTISPIACNSCGSPLKLKGEMLSSFKGTFTPLELVLNVNATFQGHILFKDPIINPVMTANVKRWYFSNNHFRSFENDNNPTTAPAPIENNFFDIKCIERFQNGTVSTYDYQNK